MQTALATRSGDAPDPILRCAEILAEMLAAGETLRRQTLSELMTAATGRSDADGGWTLRDAYDALELAQVLFVMGARSPVVEREPSATLRCLEDLARSLPTQSHRSEDQIALQAFSTPLPLAWLAALAARLSRTDLVLEPSAGTGLLAGFAARAGCRLLLNEIHPGRRRCLAAAFLRATLSSHDGELIHDLLDPVLRPTAVLMNPPFARGCGRGEDRYAAARHLLASLVRLAGGGRLGCAAAMAMVRRTSAPCVDDVHVGCRRLGTSGVGQAALPDPPGRGLASDFVPASPAAFTWDVFGMLAK